LPTPGLSHTLIAENRVEIKCHNENQAHAQADDTTISIYHPDTDYSKNWL
jgi:hypothetical protein